MSQDRPARSGKNGTIRYAVVGLGYISQAAQLPSFAHATKNSKLVALVSDDPEKLKEVGDEYGVEHRVSYDGYDQLLESGEVDAVYIGLPNHLHRDYAVRAARAGVHVLCEKPMAPTEAECRDMIRAADDAGTKLMIAYRLHFEEANLAAVEVARSGQIGEPRLFSSVFSQDIEAGNVRLKKAAGGGAIWDIGVYCLNAARYLFRAEPVEVSAFTGTPSGDPKFAEVEELAACTLRFADGRVAQFTCGFGEAKTGSYRLVGTKGDLRLDPAYGMVGDLKHHLTVDGKTTETRFKGRDQFSPLLLYFSDCVLNNKEPEPNGYEGLADVRVIEALYRSTAEGGRPVSLPAFNKADRPTAGQGIHKSSFSEPELVKARPPGGK